MSTSTFNPPRIHGLKSATFVQPPYDPALSFPAMYDWQGEHSRDHPLFVFGDSPGSKRYITWGEAIQGIHRASRYVRGAVGYSGEGPKPFIAALATSDSISYFSFTIGVLRTGWTLFLISPRNSSEAVAHLLKTTGATHLFVSVEPSVQALAENAIAHLTSSNVQKLDMPTFDHLFPIKGIDTSFVPEHLGEINMDDRALVLHSSGTTSFPKPINFTHKAMVLNSFFPCWGELDMADSVIAMHSIPLFHGMGLIATGYSLVCGFTMGVFKPQSPAIVPNPSNTINAAISDGFDYIFSSPTFPETWSRDAEYVKAIAKTKGVLFGGGPLNQGIGDYLVSQGVNITVLYAATECMGINALFPKPTDGKEWEYVQMSQVRDTRFIGHGKNEFELVILENEYVKLNVINTTMDGKGGYATSDLLSPHPTKPGFWKIVGRTDDQIMHSTGEKTNPGPLEEMLNNDPFVEGSIMFGRGRFYAGILVQPKAEFEFDPADVNKVVDFRNLIWPTIERINAFAPTHSRIFKEMILVTSPLKPILYTLKGTTRRKVTLEQYTEEIDSVYAAVDESGQADISGPSDWTLENTLDFTRKVIEKTMKKTNQELADSADLFEFGLDSLQATWIRNTLLRALRQDYPSIAREVPTTFIYDHPNIASLAKYLIESISGNSASTAPDKRQELFDLVEKYTTSFPQFVPDANATRSEGAVVLLTGGTGSLGSSILARLVESPQVLKIYSLSRPSSGNSTVEERQEKSFEREGLDQGLLKSGKVQLLEADPSVSAFGLAPNVYGELQTSVTHIIHNAWRVNFDLAVASFESNIRSVRNFIDFSLTAHVPSPARLLFISSVGVFTNYDGVRPAPEDYLAEPDSAIGIGYGESKWVSEQIMRKASEATPISTTVLRCGQMTGGPSGAWNDHEWFPSLIKSSIALGKLPASSGDIAWITAYDAAGAVVDSLNARAYPVFHVQHPRPTRWNAIIEAFAQELDIPVVPYAEWFAALEDAQRALQDLSVSGSAEAAAATENMLKENPGLRLMEFLRLGLVHEADVEGYEPPGIAKLSCSKLESVSESLRVAPVLNEGNVKKWVAAWKKGGFL